MVVIPINTKRQNASANVFWELISLSGFHCSSSIRNESQQGTATTSSAPPDAVSCEFWCIVFSFQCCKRNCSARRRVLFERRPLRRLRNREGIFSRVQRTIQAACTAVIADRL